MRWKQLSLLLVLSLAGTAAYADTTYDINLNIGGATAVGTIITDGTLGVLQTGNIKGFTVTLMGGGDSALLYNNNAYVNNYELTATSDGLFYNFDNTTEANTALIASSFSTTSNALCFTGGDNCPGNLLQEEVIRLDGVVYTQAVSGNVQIASLPGAGGTGGIAVTPEPSSLALLGTGVLGVLGAARRRFV